MGLQRHACVEEAGGQSGLTEVETPQGNASTTVLAFQLGPLQAGLCGLERL